MSSYQMSVAALACVVGATAATAGHLDYYVADLVALNDSGVSGKVYVTFDGATPDDPAKSIRVQANISGLTPGPHAAHIHGFADGSAATAPTPSVFDVDSDGDGDGFIELTEGAPFYGGILQTLTGLVAGGAGNARYFEEFEVAAGGPLDNDAVPLDNREVVVHGLFTDFEPVPVPSLGLPNGDVDGFTPADRNFNNVLPIATAQFTRTSVDMVPPAPVPLPASALLLVAGLGGLGALRRRKA